MVLFYKLSRFKRDVVFTVMILTAHIISVQNQVCLLMKRPDPSRDGTLRWSLPKEEICRCRKVLAPTVLSTCPGGDEYKAGELLFVDDPRPLTTRSSWNGESLDNLLQRTEFCADECTLKTDNCSVNAVCADIPGSFTCTCKAGYTGDGETCVDTEKPEVEMCPINITQATNPGQSTAVVVWAKPEARDNSGKVSVSCSYDSGSNFNIGDTAVECVAVDENGNENKCDFKVNVEDIEVPEFQSCPSSVAANAQCETAVVVWPELLAYDNSGETTVSCNYNSGAEFAIGYTLVQCLAVDGSGNQNECIFTVRVADACGVCWKSFQNYKYYFACSENVPFADAQIACQGMGAELASVHSQEEMDFIGGHTKHDGTSLFYWGYWVGFIQHHTRNEFVWTDGTHVNYTNWYDGEPNGDGDEGDKCGIIIPNWDDQWNDAPCTTHLGYVCKKQDA